jgi:ankyrin repeat protein
MIAIAEKQYAAARLLLAKGANDNAQNQVIFSPFLVNKTRFDLTICVYQYGRTALHWAACMNDIRALDSLLP